ncbi:MAG: DUF3253 domain-containing protein [Planctomycetes bacterium]|nr:DUF3253 domain-containing protein [Planctomycetota bacterium]
MPSAARASPLVAVPADTKLCASCGRRFAWRRRWARCWEAVRHCSDACRRHRVGPIDTRLEQAIRQLLAQRPHGATICPSAATRAVVPDDWRSWLERTRAAARRLCAAGVLDVVQGGRIVDPSAARGPIRLRLRR